jgi:hypothetical protein
MIKQKINGTELTVVRRDLMLMLIVTVIQRVIESTPRVIIHYVRLLGDALLGDLSYICQ